MKKWVKGDRGRALSYAMKSAQVTGRFGLGSVDKQPIRHSGLGLIV